MNLSLIQQRSSDIHKIYNSTLETVRQGDDLVCHPNPAFRTQVFIPPRSPLYQRTFQGPVILGMPRQGFQRKEQIIVSWALSALKKKHKAFQAPLVLVMPYAMLENTTLNLLRKADTFEPTRTEKILQWGMDKQPCQTVIWPDSFYYSRGTCGGEECIVASSFSKKIKIQTLLTFQELHMKQKTTYHLKNSFCCAPETCGDQMAMDSQ